MGTLISPITYFTSSVLKGTAAVNLTCSPNGVRLLAPTLTKGCIPVPRSATPPVKLKGCRVAFNTSSVAPSARRGKSRLGVNFTPGTVRIRFSCRSSVACLSGRSSFSGPAKVSRRSCALPISPSMRTLLINPSTTVTTTSPFANVWFCTSANERGYPLSRYSCVILSTCWTSSRRLISLPDKGLSIAETSSKGMACTPLTSKLRGTMRWANRACNASCSGVAVCTTGGGCVAPGGLSSCGTASTGLPRKGPSARAGAPKKTVQIRARGSELAGYVRLIA